MVVTLRYVRGIRIPDHPSSSGPTPPPLPLLQFSAPNSARKDELQVVNQNRHLQYALLEIEDKFMAKEDILIEIPFD